MPLKAKKGTQIFHMMKHLQKVEGNSEKLLSTVEEKLLRFHTLMEIGQLASAAMDFKNKERKILNKIRSLLICEEVSLFRLDKKKGKLFQENSEDIREVSITPHTFVGECAHYKATIHLADVSHDVRSKREKEYLKGLEIKNLLITPLIAGGELEGVLQAVNSKRMEGFNQEDIYFMELLAGQLTMALQNAELFENLSRQFLQLTETLADTLVKKDRYTGGHTKRVGVFSEMIAKELQLTAKEMNDVRLSAILHDIGKIGIEDKILKKKSPLNAEEALIMREHPRMGEEILGHIDGLENVVNGMRYHHERPDGTGYPYGLKNDEIPLIAQIISVADTFDAMISTRPYRKGLPPMMAYNEIMEKAGTQFDPKVVEAFARSFKKTGMYRPEEDKFLEDSLKIKKVA